VINNDKIMIFRSKEFNFDFDKTNGFTAVWGKTFKDDPVYSEFGPMILDIEVTDICNGVGNEGPCKFCYKSNSLKHTNNMSLTMFKNIIDRMPPVLTQMAIGADAQCESNPDVWDMMKYSREKGIIPNITVADITNHTADKLVELCGAVSVSRYFNKNYCYDSIKKLTDRGLKQTNMHICIFEESLDQVYETFNDYINGDERLKDLNAIVLLSLKTKGRGKGFTPLSQDKFKAMVTYAMDNNIPLGFDSCGCHKLLESIKDHENYKQYEMLSEPCESSLFSVYINVKGEFYPCSFTENTNGWKTGIPVDTCDNFLKDVWFNKRTVNFRDRLIENKRRCPVYDI